MNRLPDELFSWMHVDSTTGRERQYLELLEMTLRSEGLSVERQNVSDERWNLLARGPQPVELLFCTHVDTVPPFIPPTLLGETILGRGACDTKGGLFSMLQTWRQLPVARRERVGFLLLVGEEVDHIGAIVADQQLKLPSLRCVIVGEPTRNRLARGQKGILKILVQADGRAGHSAFPEAGESAIHALVSSLDRLNRASWPNDEVLGPTTFNIGKILGGVAANVFAPSAEAEILFRVTADAASLQAQVASVLGAGLRTTVLAANDSLRLTSWDRFETDVVPFNTDAPYLARHAPMVLVGPGDIRTAHSPDERITLSEMSQGVDLYTELVEGILSQSLLLPTRANS